MLGRGLGDSYAVFLLPLEREYGWTRYQLTSVYSVFLLVSGFAAPLIGMLFDRVGPRRVTLACDLVSAFVVAAIPLAWRRARPAAGRQGSLEPTRMASGLPARSGPAARP